MFSIDASFGMWNHSQIVIFSFYLKYKINILNNNCRVEHDMIHLERKTKVFKLKFIIGKIPVFFSYVHSRHHHQYFYLLWPSFTSLNLWFAVWSIEPNVYCFFLLSCVFRYKNCSIFPHHRKFSFNYILIEFIFSFFLIYFSNVVSFCVV